VALGGTMHLRDAMIDAEGNIYGEGRITFPPDPAGVFNAPQGGLVQVNTAGRGSLRFMASHETRETTTGYLRPDTTGPQISLPQGLASLLSEALALSPPANPITFALDAAGRLSTISETDPIRQGLSDWRGSVTFAAGTNSKTPGEQTARNPIVSTSSSGLTPSHPLPASAVTGRRSQKNASGNRFHSCGRPSMR
jgi:hypothetical protein